MVDKQKLVMYDAPEAASIQTVTGWVDRTGRFWGADEHMARYCGSTHRICEGCKEVLEHRTYCRTCAARKEAEKFAAMPRVPWDGTTPICIHHGDTFFFSSEELRDYCHDNDLMPWNLALVHTEPAYATQIDPNEYYTDNLPEDGEVPTDIEEAFDELNRKIQACKEPLCWWPSTTAVDPDCLRTLFPT